MVQRSACFGRPRKYREGWEKSNAKIYLAKETLEKWRELRKKLDFASGNRLAIHLLQQYDELTTLRNNSVGDPANDIQSALVDILGTSAVATHLDDIQTGIPQLNMRHEDETQNVAACNFPDQVSMSEYDEEDTFSAYEMNHNHIGEHVDDVTLSFTVHPPMHVSTPVRTQVYRDADIEDVAQTHPNGTGGLEFNGNYDNLDSDDDSEEFVIQHGQISAILYAEAERTLLCEDTSSDEDDDNVIQPQQDPEDIAELEEELGTNAEYEEASPGMKIICYIDKLMELIGCHCRYCPSPCRIIKKYISGCTITISTVCETGHVFTWASSPTMTNTKNTSIYQCNMEFASAILISDNNFYKIHQFCQFMDLKCISPSTFFVYQRLCLCPVIQRFYNHKMADVLQQHSQRDMVIAGDGRCDSPGKCAKFCTYSVMETSSNVIIHSETIDKREVHLKSPNMEREGASRAMSYLKDRINIVEITTDASTSVTSMLATDHPSVHHSMDVWHKAKLLKKVLTNAGKMRGMHKIALWSQNIVNHFWYCCRKCGGDRIELKSGFVEHGVCCAIAVQERWRGVLHHVCNVHEWYGGECEHDTLTEPPTNAHGVPIDYFVRGQPDFALLQKILMDKTWMKSLKYFTRFRHTGMLENFHNTLLTYCPKRSAFGDAGYRARMQLAVLTILI